MYRASSVLLVSCVGIVLTHHALAQELTPEHRELGPPAVRIPEPEPWNDVVDRKTTERILEFLNAAKTTAEIVDTTGIDEDTARLILQIRDAIPSGASRARGLTSLAQLQTVWTTSGSAFSKLQGAFGAWTFGGWEQLPYDAPWSAVNTILLKNGRVMFFEESNTIRTTMWDPSDLKNPVFIDPDNQPEITQWCSQTVQLRDGRILSVGGGGGHANPDADQAHIFDPDAGTNGVWTRIADMNFVRWYPSIVALGEPNYLIVGGTDSGGGTVGPMEIFNEDTETFTVVPGAGSELYWPPTYPGLHQVADGRIVFTRTGFANNPLDPPPQFFQWDDVANPVTGQWYDLAHMQFKNRIEGMSLQFMIPTDDLFEQKSRIAVFGGGGQDPTPVGKKAEIIDAEDLVVGAEWTKLPDMREPRNHCQGILLPDGKAILWGGASHGNNGLAGSFTSELFDPETDTFTRQDDLRYARGYHSAAALLPSGQVLASGGIAGPLELTMEVYSPPYLFKGPRPKITSSPAQAQHGDSFDIVTPDAGKIAKVVLVRPVCNTHNTDSEQRVLQLKFEPDVANGKVTATMPNGIDPHPHAPSGYYMLFLLNGHGVPSVAEFIRLY